MSAATLGNSDVVSVLIELKANLEAVDYAGKTALLRAAAACKPAAVRVLLEAKAHASALDRNHQTALDLCRASPASKDRDECIELLSAAMDDHVQQVDEAQQRADEARELAQYE